MKRRRQWEAGLTAVGLLLTACAQNTGTTDGSMLQTGETVSAEDSTENAAGGTTYKYGKAVPPWTAREFEATVQGDPKELVPDENTLVVLTLLPVSNEHQNAVNAYLKEKGYSFQIQFEGPSMEEIDAYMGVMPMGDLYLRRKEEGLSTDVFLSVSDDPEKNLPWFVAQGDVMDLSAYLQTEDGKELYQEINAFLSDSGDTALLDGYMEYLRQGCDGYYRLPCEFNIASAYTLDYVKGYADYYGISWTGSMQDLDIVMEKAEELLADGVAPLRIGFRLDPAALNLGGYNPYDTYWAIREEDGRRTAVDFLEDPTLRAWYARLGEYREKGYYACGEIIGEEKKVDSLEQAMAVLNLGNYIQVKPLNQDEDGRSYGACCDALGIGAYADYFSSGISIAADTEHFEECTEYLHLFYGDMAFRNLLYYGPEGWSYRIDRDTYGTPDDPVLLRSTVHMDGITDSGLNNTLKAQAEALRLPFFEELHKAEMAALRVAKPPIVSNRPRDWDLSEVQGAYSACMGLYEQYNAVFLGAYGAQTEEKLDELHEKLLEAGLQEVLDYMTEYLAKEE